MTVGDMTYNIVTLLPSQFADISPNTSGIEWMIHNIIIPFGESVEIYNTNGSNSILICYTTTSLLSYSFHCNTSHYYQIKNTSGVTLTVAYNGIVTKE